MTGFYKKNIILKNSKQSHLQLFSFVKTIRKRISLSFAARPLSPTTCDRKPSNYGDFIVSSLERSSPHFQDRATGSEEDWRSEQPEKKKRQRTTFSPIEVWEFKQAFQRRPYLTPADEEKLVQRLGIPAKSVKVS